MGGHNIYIPGRKLYPTAEMGIDIGMEILFGNIRNVNAEFNINLGMQLLPAVYNEPPDYITTDWISKEYGSEYYTEPIAEPITIPSDCDLAILTIFNHQHEDITAPPTITNNSLIEIPQAPGRYLDLYGYEQEMHTYYVINPTTGNQTLNISKNLPSYLRWVVNYYKSDGVFSLFGTDISSHTGVDFFGKDVSVKMNKTNLIYIAAMAFYNWDLPYYSLHGVSYSYYPVWNGLGGGVVGFNSGHKILDADVSETEMKCTNLPMTHFEHICQYAIFEVN